MATPLELERSALGYHLEEVRGKLLRVVHRSCPTSDLCVFLVHGGGGRAGQFKHQIRTLKDEVNIVAVDFLGHGDSPQPNQPQLYTADEHLEDLQFLYEKHKKQRNIFVAHCYGTIHTLRLMERLSDGDRLAGEIAGVILIALGNTCPASVGLLGKLPAFVLEWLRPLARSSSNAAIFTPTTEPTLIEFENSISNGNRMYMMKVLGVDCSSQPRWDEWLASGKAAISSCDMPVAMVAGDSDGVFPVSSCSNVQTMFGVADEAFHIIEFSGHLPMLEKPDEVTQIIRDFITSHH